MAVWYIVLSFWYVFHVLVCCTKKNMASLADSIFIRHSRRKNNCETRPQIYKWKRMETKKFERKTGCPQKAETESDRFD
jgi:hypothetical protein